MSKNQEDRPIIDLSVRGKVDDNMLARAHRSIQIMAEKSWERGDAWKRTGMWGAFIEIYSCYNRLAKLMEDGKADLGESGLPISPEFKKEIENVTMDIRNFTVLLELAMDANKFDSDYKVEKPTR